MFLQFKGGVDYLLICSKLCETVFLVQGWNAGCDDGTWLTASKDTVQMEINIETKANYLSDTHEQVLLVTGKTPIKCVKP